MVVNSVSGIWKGGQKNSLTWFDMHIYCSGFSEKQENVLLLKEEAQSLRRKLDRAETRACQVEQLQVDKQV